MFNNTTFYLVNGAIIELYDHNLNNVGVLGFENVIN